MKIRILALLALGTAFVAGPTLHAQPPDGKSDSAPAQAGKKKDKPDTPLEKQMKKMSKAYRTLKKQVPDAANNASSLELVATMQAAAEEAIKLIPDKASDLPEADREKFTKDFQAKMKDFQDQLGKLVALLKDNKNEDATKLVAQLGQIEKDDHKEFRRPE